jgi:hypothetical protein
VPTTSLKHSRDDSFQTMQDPPEVKLHNGKIFRAIKLLGLRKKMGACVWNSYVDGSNRLLNRIDKSLHLVEVQNISREAKGFPTRLFDISHYLIKELFSTGGKSDSRTTTSELIRQRLTDSTTGTGQPYARPL